MFITRGPLRDYGGDLPTTCVNVANMYEHTMPDSGRHLRPLDSPRYHLANTVRVHTGSKSAEVFNS